MTRFRYSRTKFWLALVVALGLTAMVTGLTWMIFVRLGNPNANTITAAAGLIFLAFFSARMAFQFFRNEVVLAILPTGIEDARWGIGLIEWERIKEIALSQRENEFELNVYLWRNGDVTQILAIDLEALESDVDTIINAITVYLPVRAEY
jgi:hypothetical protein